MEFSRDLMKDLVKWKEDIRRKPLILHGARQVGKTWLLKHFGQQFFEDVAYFNFDEQPDLIDLFNIDKDPNRIIKQLSYLYGRSINPQAGLIHLTTLNKEPKLPLSAYDDLSIFKIYLSDIGLLRRLAKLSAGSLLSPTSGFTEFKGALAENYVLQSLKTQFEVPLRYWTSARSAEVDFILQDKYYILPIEVKSGTNVYGKSLQIYNTKFQPKYRIRYSGLNLSKDDNLLNIPLFMSDYTTKIFKLLEFI